MSWMFNPFVAVFIGGGIGSILRYLLSIKLNTANSLFPLATLYANLLGALIIGSAFAYVSASVNFNTNIKLFIMTGLCGGLTTFSTFSLDIFTFIQKGQWILVTTTLLANVVLTVIMVSLSFYITTKFLIK